MKTKLTESQISLIALCLRMGVEKFNNNAHDCADAHHPGLAAEFDHQREDARALAVMFEDMPESVEVTA